VPPDMVQLISVKTWLTPSPILPKAPIIIITTPAVIKARSIIVLSTSIPGPMKTHKAKVRKLSYTQALKGTLTMNLEKNEICPD